MTKHKMTPGRQVGWMGRFSIGEIAITAISGQRKQPRQKQERRKDEPNECSAMQCDARCMYGQQVQSSRVHRCQK
jgi:hypothetical protein